MTDFKSLLCSADLGAFMTKGVLASLELSEFSFIKARNLA